MAKKQSLNFNTFGKGLHLDHSPIDQPKGTYRFALNTVPEAEFGDSSFKSNEESNEIYTSLTPGFIPIGKEYIGNNQNVIFSVSADDTVSEIGILDDNGKYTVHVNDATSSPKNKLGFKSSRQIEATYRLRRGCERTIYFTGKDYPVRYFNFDKPNQFKDNGVWSAPKFSLYKSLGTFPTLDSVEVLDNAGSLTPGSYSILVQHLDEDLNSSEFYELVKNINIYNDPLNKTFSDIEGSSNITSESTGEQQPFKYGKTSKAISIKLDAVDTNYAYVRFAFVERISGNGEVSSVKYSAPVSIVAPMFTYTGTNAETSGTIEEVELYNLNSGIQSAEHIEQIDNMLILANVKGGQENICKLQQYASKIKTDAFVKDIILTSLKENHNPKNPLVDYYGIGYQPGDIYSLGIQYVFEDYTVSPVFHIPGKSSQVSSSLVYAPEAGVYPMSNHNNKNTSEVYTDENTSCPTQDFWGRDAEGNPLKNTFVRHHRFPTRDEVNVGFVSRKETIGGVTIFKRLVLSLEGALKRTDVDSGYIAENFDIILRFKRNGFEETFYSAIFPNATHNSFVIKSNIYQDSDTLTDIRVYYKSHETNIEEQILLTNNISSKQPNGLTYKVTPGAFMENDAHHVYQVPIFGLKLSNVTLPTEEEIGKKVIGYQIVRHERTSDDKNILDSGVIFPMQKSGRNVSTAMLSPEFWNNNFDSTPAMCEGSTDNTYPTCYNISKRNVMMVTPEHKFMDKTFDNFTSIEEVGLFEQEYKSRSASSSQNVMDGSSATGSEDPETEDFDGMTLRHGYRFTGVKYKKSGPTKLNISSESTSLFNLEAINYTDTEDGQETLYNLSFDNKALIVSNTKYGVDINKYGPHGHIFPYVYIKRNNSTFYQNFRNRPYYLASGEVFTGDTCKVFGGDTHVVPLRYSNHIFGNAVAALRREELSTWAMIGSVLLVIAGVVLAVTSGGLALPLVGGILLALGGVVTGAATMIQAEKFSEIYTEKWKNNLDKTVFDYFYSMLFTRESPHSPLGDSYEPDPHHLSWQDDTFRWFGDIVGDLWFETTLNLSLRVPPNNVEQNYLLPLKAYMPDRWDKWSALTHVDAVEYVPAQGWTTGDRFHRYKDKSVAVEYPEEWFFIKKITDPDPRPGGLLYHGMSTPQVYLVNPDHNVRAGVKKFYTIPLEYDCCSECREFFPHRIHYSQQSFQEEKSDNYRMFLPNNYRDIEGETGHITNLYRFYNNLYVHTEEALWQMGRNYQERVTDNVVSFIGTGSYFEIPPQKVLDDDTGSSAGTRHKWGSIKTPAGIFFVSENQRKIYQFSGKDLKPISNTGLSNWFKNNLEIALDKNYLKSLGKEYPNRDNPSHLLGTGFLSTYDTKKERIIFTKKDFKLKNNLFQADQEFCMNGNTITVFPDIAETVTNQSALGWTYEGIENCKMKFSKKVITTGGTTETTQIWHQPVYEEIVNPNYKFVKYYYAGGHCGGMGDVEDERCHDYFRITDINGTQYNELVITPGNSHWGGVPPIYTQWPLMVINSWVDISDPNSVKYWGGTNPNGDSNAIYDFLDIDETKVYKELVLIREGYWEYKTIEVPNISETTEYMYINGTQMPLGDLIEHQGSWTVSYSLKEQSWTSWHSYAPNFYIHVPEKFYSWKQGNDNIWVHNVIGHYQTYYGQHHPHIIEYVSVSNPLFSRIWTGLSWQTEAKSYYPELMQFRDERYVTFNKMVVYNSRQCSGELELEVKGVDEEDMNFLFNQIDDTDKTKSIIDRREKDWYANNFRDIRTKYNEPIWISTPSLITSTGYVDKILNTDSMNPNKDWSQLESFNDKYLSVRLIFDSFADKKLITNFLFETEDPSLH